MFVNSFTNIYFLVGDLSGSGFVGFFLYRTCNLEHSQRNMAAVLILSIEVNEELS